MTYRFRGDITTSMQMKFEALWGRRHAIGHDNSHERSSPCRGTQSVSNGGSSSFLTSASPVLVQTVK